MAELEPTIMFQEGQKVLCLYKAKCEMATIINIYTKTIRVLIHSTNKVSVITPDCLKELPSYVKHIYKDVGELYKNAEYQNEVLLENHKELFKLVEYLQRRIDNLEEKEKIQEIRIHGLTETIKTNTLIHELELKELRKLINKSKCD
jgi:hypothetical protein